MILIDQVMPSCDRSEVHCRATAASPPALWTAVHDLRAGEVKAMRVLMGLRTLGRRAGESDRTVLEGFERMGFRPVAEDPGQELVIVGIGHFWKPSGGLQKVTSKEQFLSFQEPGYAKTAFNFRIEDGELSTETRIAGTDARARRLFGLYWLLIRPGSGLIRREWLRAIDRRAGVARSCADLQSG
ncbi:MAG TPA: hypothetical protein VFR75_04925 [Solirubrobacterales bacterium]|nr:hypothetical protein [Solirubrobacterales bacterium]